MEDIKEINGETNEEIIEEVQTTLENEVTEEYNFVCEKCGKVYNEPQKFCGECGHEIGTPVVIPKYHCKHCGAEYLKGQKFCNSCGERLEIDIILETRSFFKRIFSKIFDKKYKKIHIAASIVAIVVIFGLVIGLTVSSVFSSKNKFKRTFLNRANLEKIYDKYCDDDFAELGEDGSYLKIKWSEEQDYDVMDKAYTSIYKVNKALKLPESLNKKIGETSDSDGVQFETYDKVDVTWSYDVDDGFEILYER